MFALYWRLGLLAGALALYPIVYVKGRHDGARKVENRVLVDKARANEEARRMETLRQARVDESVAASVTRQAGIRADSARAGDAVSRLRDAIATRDVAEESASAATKRADTAEKLLIESSDAYRELARAADGHAGDVTTLLDAWPTDSPTKGKP